MSALGWRGRFTITALMPITVRSFAKVNLGLGIGPRRADGFHELRTVYQTIALHDAIRVHITRGAGIEIRCEDPRVPKDESNTCYRIAERVMQALRAKGRVVIEIEKRLPVQGGLGGASGNGVAVMLAMERALGKELSGAKKMEIAAEVGSDLPLFLVGGTVLGVGRGEEVYPLADLPATACVIATPEMGISTPKAFAEWDGMISKLTPTDPSDRMVELGRELSAWLSSWSQGGVKRSKAKTGKGVTGVPGNRGRGRAETLLLDLVRTGIENDFERVVFPQYPELREVKQKLEGAGAGYASLSGSGSATYGLFESRAAAEKTAATLRKSGVPAVATTTLTRPQYWRELWGRS